MTGDPKREIPALRVHQWLPGWNKIAFDPDEYRTKPPEHFYLFSLPAKELRSLSGIMRRVAKNGAPRTEDLNIQRQHDPERSEEISRFVEYGFPWSTLSAAKRASPEFNDLRKPGWLPTAVVLNIFVKDSERNGTKIDDSDVVQVEERNGTAVVQLPYSKWQSGWNPKGLPPFEIIDGQHRLWAFDNTSQFDDFELPVVAFVGLDISWQAYLFWTINIKPKRINASLAFDLYPLLRGEDWLDRAEGHAIYRETRAQELTEILWSNPQSPWYDRINMLGENQNPWVSQSAWIKSLIATFIKSWDPSRSGTGGLFGGRSKRNDEVLGWSRPQQAAFLIFAWEALRSEIERTTSNWAQILRRPKQGELIRPKDDQAFYGPYSLLNTDQGVRGFLQVLNDVCYVRAPILKLNKWPTDERVSLDSKQPVDGALASIQQQPFKGYVTDIAKSLASFDWRTSAAPELEEQLRRTKLTFRGSSGYKELRVQLLEHLSTSDNEVGQAAKRLLGVA